MRRKCLCTLLLVACFVLGMLALPVSATTDSGTVDTWKWTVADGTLTISGTGTVTGFPSDSSEGYMKYNMEIRHIVIEEGITVIAPFSFQRTLFNLESIWIADSVTTIGEMAFANNFKVEQLRLGSGLKTIGEGAFTTLERLKSLMLPAGVQSIKGEAFSLSGIKTLSIPEGISVINDGAFRASANLTSVFIPNSVKEIKYAAFRDCDNLTDVYYSGSQAQWEAVEIDNTVDGKGDSNGGLLYARVHYNHTHTWDAGTVTTAATCIEAGEKTYTCTVCNTVKTESVAKTTEHTWDSGTQNADTTVTYHCTICGAGRTEGTPVAEQPSVPESTGTEPTTEPTTEPSTEPSVAVGTDENKEPSEPADQQDKSKNIVWIAVGVGVAVLTVAGGAVAWFRTRKTRDDAAE